MRNRKFLLSLVVLLLVLTIILAYQNHKITSQNLALKLKLHSQAQKTRKAVAWQPLLNAKPTEKTVDKAPTNAEPPVTELANLPTSQLVQQLDSKLKNYNQLEANELQQAIELADEVIDRERNAYSAYKAKLMLLLKHESLNNADLDREIDETFTELSTFDLSESELLRKEAFLIARSNAQLSQLESSLLQIQAQNTEFTRLLSQTDPESEEAKNLNLMIELNNNQITELQNKALENDVQLQSNLASVEDSTNEDLLDVYFQRLLAKNEFENVANEAEAIIAAYPDSINAYVFLVRALELNNMPEAAMDVITESNLTEDQIRALEIQLKKLSQLDVKNYWRNLKF